MWSSGKPAAIVKANGDPYPKQGESDKTSP